MHRIHLFVIAVAVLSMLTLQASHADERNPSSLLSGETSQATVPDIAGTWIAGDVGYLKRVIRRLDDGTGDCELLPPAGAGRKGETLRLKWSAKDRKFIGDRASIDGTRRSITLLVPDGEYLHVTQTFDEASLKEMPSPFPHGERWRRFVPNPELATDARELPAWEPETKKLARQIEIQEGAAATEAAAIRELEANARGKSAQASLIRREAALEKSLQEIFSLKLELDQGQLHRLKSRLATLETQIEERRQLRDRIVERRLKELLETTTPQPPNQPTKTTTQQSFRVDLPFGRSAEFVGITTNTRPAAEGWRPDGSPLEKPGFWPVNRKGEDNPMLLGGGKQLEPAPNAIDVLLRFEGLKREPSFFFDWPTEDIHFQQHPLTNPYEIRVTTRRRERHPPEQIGGERTRDHAWRIGITDEEWGRFVTVRKDGSVVNPIRSGETFAETYQLVQVAGIQPHETLDTALVLRLPPENTEPGNPLHRFVFEIEAVDSQSDRLAMKRSAAEKEGEYVYTLVEPLPSGRTLSHFDYRLRPYRYWVTFRNVAIEPGEMTKVTSTVETFQPEKRRDEKRKPPVEVGAAKKHDLFAWQHNSEAVVATGDGVEGDDVHFWKLTPQGAAHERIGAEPHTYALATSRRSALAVAGTNAGTVHLWDAGSRQLIHKIEPPLPEPYAIYAVAISPDDSRIAACGTGGTIFIYDQQGKVVSRIESGKDRFLADLQFSPDGEKLAAVDQKGRLTLWSFPAGEPIGNWPDLGIARYSALQWSSSGDRLALVSEGFVAMIEPRAESKPQKNFAPENICLMIPKDFLEGKVPGNYRVQAGLPDGVRYVGATTLAPDFNSAATVKINGSLAIWDVNTKDVIVTLPPPACLRQFEHSGPCLKGIAYSPTGAIVGAVVKNGPLVFWKLTEASSLLIIDHEGKPTSVNDVVQTRVGLDTVPPRDWIGRPGRDGLISLAELPTSEEVLLAAGDLPERTLFHLRKFPIPGDTADQRLNPPTSPNLNKVEIKVVLETHVGRDIMVVKLHNPTPQELRLSERDVQLQTEIPVPGEPDHPRSVRVRGLSPQLLADRVPTGEIAIAPGESGQLTLDWNDWFHSAYWSSREHEIAAEPALPPPADGQLLVRVCVGGASAMPVQVTIPKPAQAPAPRTKVKRLNGGEDRPEQNYSLLVHYDMPGCEPSARMHIYAMNEDRAIGGASVGKGVYTWTEIENGGELLVDRLAAGEYQLARLRTYPLLKNESGSVFSATRKLDARRIRLEKEDAEASVRVDFVRPRSSKKLTGIIQGLKDQGLNQAVVFVCELSAKGTGSLYRQEDICFDVAITDVAGRFETEPLPPGRYKLLVAGYTLMDPQHITPSDIDFPRFFAEQEIAVEESSTPKEIEMRLEAVTEDGSAVKSEDDAAPPSDDHQQSQTRDQAVHPQGEIRGQLLDEAGKPVSGATVACGAFLNETGSGGTRDVTDAEGRFRLQVPSPGIYIVYLKELKRDRKLVVVADDSVLAEAGRITTSRLALSTGRKVSGTVVDGDAKPVGALRVRYYSPASPNSIGGGETTHTNDRGEFEFFVPPGRLYVEAFFVGTRDDIEVGRAKATIPAEGEVPPLRLPLRILDSRFGDPAWVERSTPGTKIVRHEDAADVTGIVVDDKGAPVAEAKVFREGTPVVVTDKDGKFRMPIEKGTQFVMYAFAPGNRVWFGTPTAGDELTIVLEKKDAK